MHERAANVTHRDLCVTRIKWPFAVFNCMKTMNVDEVVVSSKKNVEGKKITYGVATVSRIDKIICLFCKRAL